MAMTTEMVIIFIMINKGKTVEIVQQRRNIKIRRDGGGGGGHKEE